jgi:hypothetical protein
MTVTLGERPADGIGRVRGPVAGALATVLPAWVAARAAVGVALVAAHLLVHRVRPGNAGAALRVHQGLLVWDARWYESIATVGYGASGRQALRFFPALPLAGRIVGWFPGIGPGLGVIIVANLAALGGMAVLVVLVRTETGDEALARRSVWLLALAPPAFCLVLGYAEGLLLLCTTTAFLALRSGRWWWAAAAGFAAGTVRPVGLLLAVPAVIEVCRWRWEGGRRPTDGLARWSAVVAPLAGAGACLGWVGVRYYDPWLPFQLQESRSLRGPVTWPLQGTGHQLVELVHGHDLLQVSHLPWVVLSLVLLVMVFRRLPASYGAFSAAVLAVSFTSSNLGSVERYALSAFPLVIVASMWTGRRRTERNVLIVAGLAMVGYALLAFVGILVP